MLVYDLVIRYLKFKGYNVKWVMNITDVDDKTIRDSQREGKTLQEFTEFYSKS
jgi:cysteinyl-tRNA synthetase